MFVWLAATAVEAREEVTSSLRRVRAIKQGPGVAHPEPSPFHLFFFFDFEENKQQMCCKGFRFLDTIGPNSSG